ncbi:MAG: restriction endonuclease subunit S [Acidobacteria bacterium]|nr:restriction endonuclease subunit S [Acidobacteriota bacterium]MBI3655780.1 restriction endonuclease subunit S [Acidobacteriota bacterium]
MAAVDPTARSVSESEHREFTGGGARFHSGDTLMARITPCLENGKIARFRPTDKTSPGFGSTEFIVIRGRENVTENDFAYYLTKWSEFHQFAVAQMTGTSGRQRVPAESLSGFEATIPPLPTQRSIAHVLGMLDDKIELNRRVNRTLEKMAAALFKNWFIDFDPVRAKAEGRDPGLPQAIADLFPDEFEDSELGEIPEGWTVKSLPEAIEVNPSRSLSRGTAAPYVEMSAMPTQLSRPAGWPRREFSSGSRFRNGDILVARITPCLENGKTAFVDFLDRDEIGWGSTEYIVFCSGPPLPPEFTYFLARSDRFREHAIANMTGTSGRQRVPATCFDRFQVTVPSESVATAFGNMVQPALRKTRANDFQSKKLEKLRDALLPKLLSGELEVPAIVQSKEGEA